MKIAYIILAHKNATQVSKLVEQLNVCGNSFFIHIDKGCNENFYKEVVNKLKRFDNVFFIKRYRSAYGSFGLIEATLEGLKRAIDENVGFDYLINLSGQDYPIKSNLEITKKLNSNQDKSYLWNFPLPFEDEHPQKGWVCQRLNRIEYWHFKYKNFYFRFPYKKLRGNGIFSAVKYLPLWAFSKIFLPDKRKFFKDYTPYGGGQWWCLNKKHTNYTREFIEKNDS